MFISSKRLDLAVRQARALRTDRVEIHVAKETLHANWSVFQQLISEAAHAGQNVTIAANSMIEQGHVQCRNLEDGRRGRIAPIVDVRPTDAETICAGG